MAVKLRLRRMGACKKPFFRIVAADARSANEGSFLEELGWYEPASKSNPFKVNVAAADAWIAKGAQPSPTVSSLINKARNAAPAAADAQADADLAAQAEAEAPAEEEEAAKE